MPFRAGDEKSQAATASGNKTKKEKARLWKSGKVERPLTGYGSGIRSRQRQRREAAVKKANETLEKLKAKSMNAKKQRPMTKKDEMKFRHAAEVLERQPTLRLSLEGETSKTLKRRRKSLLAATLKKIHEDVAKIEEEINPLRGVGERIGLTMTQDDEQEDIPADLITRTMDKLSFRKEFGTNVEPFIDDILDHGTIADLTHVGNMFLMMAKRDDSAEGASHYHHFLERLSIILRQKAEELRENIPTREMLKRSIFADYPQIARKVINQVYE